MKAWQAVMGLEIHAQLMTRSKIFCHSPIEYGKEENTLVGPSSGGLPGALPSLNQEAVRLAVLAGHVLNCKIQSYSRFDRKNYFYPDLPKGYQITQFFYPICTQGFVEIQIQNKPQRKISIHRIHLEEDAGKLTHLGSSTHIDLNRAGTPLIEIVSEPEIHTPAEAAACMKKIHYLLEHAQICDGNLEEGNFRCDVNISVRPLGEKTFGTRVELKNINSFRFVEKAAEYEISRQIAILESGGRILQETRGWDAVTGKTFSLREKEEAHDYRYFPDPDLPPLILNSDWIEEIKKQMPQFPDEKKAELIEKWGISPGQAELLSHHKDFLSYFEKCVEKGAPAELAVSWIVNELWAHLKERNQRILSSPISPEKFVSLLEKIQNNTLSAKMAKGILAEMIETGKEAQTLIEEKGLIQIVDRKQIESWIEQVLHQKTKLVAEYHSGKAKVFDYFVGKVIGLSRGKANPALVQEILKKKLS